MHIVGEDLQVISENTLCKEDFTRRLRDFLFENNCDHDACKFNYKFAFTSFLSFRRIQKRESNFQQNWLFDSIWFYFKGMPILMDIYKEILLHIVSVRIIVLW